MILYKYCDFSLRTQRVLLTNEVWFATRSTLNDPFDCDPQIKCDVREAELDEFLTIAGVEFASALDNVEKQKLILDTFREQQLDDIGVYCLTNDAENELMWAHYADNHRGMVIGWRLEQTVPESDEQNHMFAQDVKYSGRGTLLLSDIIHTARQFSLDNGQRLASTYYSTKDAITRIINASYLQKNPPWGYEDEIRFVKMDGFGNTAFDAKLVSLTYGCRFDENLIPQVRMALQEDVDEYQVVLGSTGLERLKMRE